MVCIAQSRNRCELWWRISRRATKIRPRWSNGIIQRRIALTRPSPLALEDNVVTWVLEKVTVTDKPMTLDELMGRS